MVGLGSTLVGLGSTLVGLGSTLVGCFGFTGFVGVGWSSSDESSLLTKRVSAGPAPVPCGGSVGLADATSVLGSARGGFGGGGMTRPESDVSATAVPPAVTALLRM